MLSEKRLHSKYLSTALKRHVLILQGCHLLYLVFLLILHSVAYHKVSSKYIPIYLIYSDGYITFPFI